MSNFLRVVVGVLVCCAVGARGQGWISFDPTVTVYNTSTNLTMTQWSLSSGSGIGDDSYGTQFAHSGISVPPGGMDSMFHAGCNTWYPCTLWISCMMQDLVHGINSHAVWSVDSAPFGGGGIGGYSFHVGGAVCTSPCPTNPGCALYYVTMGVRNNAPYSRTFQVAQGGSALSQPCGLQHDNGGVMQLGSYGTLDPGRSGTFTVAVCDTNNLKLTEAVGNPGYTGDGAGNCWLVPDPGDPNSAFVPLAPGQYSQTNSLGAPVTGFGTNTPGPIGNQPSQGGYTPPGVDGTGTNGIQFGTNIFGAQATNSTVGALVTGFGALYSAAQVANGTLGRIEQALYKADKSLAALTNGAGGVGSTNGSGTNVGWNGAGVTNLLGQILQANLAQSNLLFGVSGGLGGISNATMLVNGGVSNLFGGITNMHGTLRGMSNSLAGLSNGIGQLVGYGSNQWWLETNLMASTSADGWTNLAGGLSTNGASAWAQGLTDASGIKGTLDGMEASASSIGSGLADPGGADSYTIHMGLVVGGRTVPDFKIGLLDSSKAYVYDSFSFLPGMLNTAWTYFLYLAYAYWVAKTMRSASTDLFAARGVTVQPMEMTAAGFGGNAAGAFVYGFVVVGVLVVWAAALAIIFSTVVGAEDWSAIIGHLTGDPFGSATGGSSVGIHWVYASFPVKLAVSLISARIIWRLTMIYVVSLTRFALRFLPGA